MRSKPSEARALAFVERTKAKVVNQATRVLSLPLPPVLVHPVHKTGAPFFSSAHRSQKILPDRRRGPVGPTIINLLQVAPSTRRDLASDTKGPTFRLSSTSCSRPHSLPAGDLPLFPSPSCYLARPSRAAYNSTCSILHSFPNIHINCHPDLTPRCVPMRWPAARCRVVSFSGFCSHKVTMCEELK